MKEEAVPAYAEQRPLNPSPFADLESMQLDRALGNALFGQELGNLQALIALELDDLARLFVVDEGTVAGEFLRMPCKRIAER